jgi:hypothetical protein
MLPVAMQDTGLAMCYPSIQEEYTEFGGPTARRVDVFAASVGGGIVLRRLRSAVVTPLQKRYAALVIRFDMTNNTEPEPTDKRDGKTFAGKRLKRTLPGARRSRALSNVLRGEFIDLLWPPPLERVRHLK